MKKEDKKQTKQDNPLIKMRFTDTPKNEAWKKMDNKQDNILKVDIPDLTNKDLFVNGKKGSDPAVVCYYPYAKRENTEIAKKMADEIRSQITNNNMRELSMQLYAMSYSNDEFPAWFIDFLRSLDFSNKNLNVQKQEEITRKLSMIPVCYEFKCYKRMPNNRSTNK